MSEDNAIAAMMLIHRFCKPSQYLTKLQRSFAPSHCSSMTSSQGVFYTYLLLISTIGGLGKDRKLGVGWK